MQVTVGGPAVLDPRLVAATRVLAAASQAELPLTRAGSGPGSGSGSSVGEGSWNRMEQLGRISTPVRGGGGHSCWGVTCCSTADDDESGFNRRGAPSGAGVGKASLRKHVVEKTSLR